MEADIERVTRQELSIDKLLCNLKNRQGKTPKEVSFEFAFQTGDHRFFNKIKEWELKFLARSRSSFFKDSPSPHYNWREAVTAEGQYGWIVHPTAQIVEVGERGEIKDRFCTGFNIGENLFLTAGHCLANNDKDGFCYRLNAGQPLSKYRISFNYQYPNLKQERQDIQESLYSCTQVMKTGTCDAIQSVAGQPRTVNSRVDFAVLKIEPAAQQKFGQVYLSEDYSPTPGNKIAIAHHAGGRPKKLSEGALVSIASTTYSSHDDTTDYSADLNHTGLTHGGSSGAPIGLPEYECVVGIHVAGDDVNNHLGLSVKDVQNKLINEKRYNNLVPLLPLYKLKKQKQLKSSSTAVLRPREQRLPYSLNYAFSNVGMS
jgi:hypothetical protein